MKTFNTELYELHREENSSTSVQLCSLRDLCVEKNNKRKNKL
jgi:hypothetical protein